MVSKKGISPLIATVLIIGFVIVLAALVMQWGSGLFENIKEETSTSSEISLACSTGLTNLKVMSATYTDDLNEDGTSDDPGVKVVIDNSNEQEIAGFLFRGHLADGTVITKTLDFLPKLFKIFHQPRICPS